MSSDTKLNPQESMATLYGEYSGLVYRTAYWLLETREEAEDALNDIFLGLYRSLATYDPAKGKMSTWIYRVTVNHCLKRRGRVLRRFFSLEERPLAETASPKMRPSEEDGELREALGRLPDPLRALVVLRYAWQLTYAEISEILGIPVGTVKSRHSLALQKLRQYFGSDRMAYGLQKDRE